MRDLDRIQEADPRELPVRRLGVLFLAALATGTLVFGVAAMIGDAARGPEETAEDPLAALDRAAGLAAADPLELETPPEVDREALRFPEELTDGDDRPEVAAALAAAAAELAHPDPLHPEAPVRKEPEGVTFGVSAGSLAARPPAVLTQATRPDPILEKAPELVPVVKKAPVAKAAPGRAGEYTLQVISYERSQEAELFAEALRNRGHKAFVTTADLPGRGRYFRVRIGPFETQREADAYRASFEESERMNTFVVKRRDDGN